MSLIDRLTAEAQVRRDAFGYGTWRFTDATGTRQGRITEDLWAVVARADAKFLGPERVRQPEPLRRTRYAMASRRARNGGSGR
jgi:hypothetical protein